MVKDEYAHDVQNLGEINKFEYEYEHTNSADTLGSAITHPVPSPFL